MKNDLDSTIITLLIALLLGAFAILLKLAYYALIVLGVAWVISIMGYPNPLFPL